MGDGRDTLSHQRLLLLVVLCKQRGLLERYLLEASPADIPAAAQECDCLRRRKRERTDRISPLVNSKVNTVERKRKEVYLCHTDWR